MKFNLSNVEYFFSEKNKEHKEALESLGFKFEPYQDDEDIYKFTIDYDELNIEINTLEELMELIDKVGNIIINRFSITIYDDYVE